MKQALVIGSTRSIGAGVANVLSEKAWTVSTTGVGEDEVAAYAAKHPETTCAQLEVSDTSSVNAFFAN